MCVYIYILMLTTLPQAVNVCGRYSSVLEHGVPSVITCEELSGLAARRSLLFGVCSEKESSKAPTAPSTASSRRGIASVVQTGGGSDHQGCAACERVVSYEREFGRKASGLQDFLQTESKAAVPCLSISPGCACPALYDCMLQAPDSTSGLSSRDTGFYSWIWMISSL